MTGVCGALVISSFGAILLGHCSRAGARLNRRSIGVGGHRASTHVAGEVREPIAQR
jgi:hypothetical protein